MTHQTVTVGPRADYTTIQEAHDALPKGGEDRREGSGKIEIDGAYDPEAAGERFPIVIEKYLDIEGKGQRPVHIDCPNDEANVIEFRNPNDTTFFEQCSLESVYITGGKHAVVLDGMTSFTARNVIVRECGGNGFHAVRDTSEAGLFGAYLEDCMAWACGGRGYSFPVETVPHGATLIHCNATYCDDHGALLGGFTNKVIGGAYQLNGGRGIKTYGGGALSVRDAYIEYNGSQNSTAPRDLEIGFNTRGSLIENCYFHGRVEDREPDTHAAIKIGDAPYCRVRDCTFRDYHEVEESGGTGAMFDITPEARDVDVHLGSHDTIGEFPAFLERPPEVLSNGVLYAEDLTTVGGKYPGALGVEIGNGDASGMVPLAWNPGKECWENATQRIHRNGPREQKDIPASTASVRAALNELLSGTPVAGEE